MHVPCTLSSYHVGMVVHPSPGHSCGTMVNAVLHHYSLPAVSVDDVGTSELPTATPPDEGSDCDQYKTSPEDRGRNEKLHRGEAILRPGIVHRLDKGTTGLMVVCRTDVAMLKLGEQFRNRTVLLLTDSVRNGKILLTVTDR